MDTRFRPYTDLITDVITEKFESLVCQYPDYEDIYKYLFEDLRGYSPNIVRGFMGTLIINFVEGNYTNLKDYPTDMIEQIKQMDIDEIESAFACDEDFFLDAIECTVEKTEVEELQKEMIYNLILNSEFANIYSRFDPFFEIDHAIHTINASNNKCDILANFYHNYNELKEVLQYNDHVIYILCDIIQNKQDPKISKELIGELLKQYYYFTKGRILLQDNISKEEGYLVEEIEKTQYLEEITDVVYKDTAKLTLVVNKNCQYHDNYYNSIQLKVENIASQKKYMKNFPHKKKKDN